MKTGIIVLSIAVLCSGCISPKTWNGNVYEAPTDLLKKIDHTLEALCPKPSPTPTPLPPP